MCDYPQTQSEAHQLCFVEEGRMEGEPHSRDGRCQQILRPREVSHSRRHCQTRRKLHGRLCL